MRGHTPDRPVIPSHVATWSTCSSGGAGFLRNGIMSTALNAVRSVAVKLALAFASIQLPVMSSLFTTESGVDYETEDDYLKVLYRETKTSMEHKVT